MTSKLFLLSSLLLASVVSLHAAFWTIGSGAVDTVARARLGVHTNRVDNPHEVTLSQLGIATATVSRAIEVIGAQSTLIETAWQNPANAADWTWTSNGREITLTGYSGPNAVVIPDMLDGLPVTGFGGIFTGNQDITSVGGGANIKAIGAYAFDSCGALTSVSLPACTTVGNAAIDSCASLISVSLPACTTVGAYAFAWCGDLSSVTFGQNAPAPAAGVFNDATPTIYVSNPHATGWGDTWNGRPVVRAANMADIAALETGVPAAGCTANGTGTTLTITGAPPPIAWQAVPSGALAVSVAANAPRNRFYSITVIGKAVSSWPAGALVMTNSSGTSPFVYAIGPYTGALWQVVGGGR